MNSASHLLGVGPVYSGFCISICVIGLVGNITVILTVLIVKQLRKSIPSWFILQLAIADTAFLLTLPFQVTEQNGNEWHFPNWMCKAKQAVFYVNYYSSVAFLTLMAFDRYITICHSFSERLRKFKTRKAACIVSVIVWTVSLLFCIPIILFSEVRGVQPNCRCIFHVELQLFMTPEERCEIAGYRKGVPLYASTELEICLALIEVFKDVKEVYCARPIEQNQNIKHGNNETEPFQTCKFQQPGPVLFGFRYFNFVVMFLIPFVIIITCYTLIIRYTMKTSARLESVATRSKSRIDSDRRLVLTCVALVLVFTLCWLPSHIVNIAKMIEFQASERTCTALDSATTFLAYLNSALDPFVYFIILRTKTQFRKFKKSRFVSIITVPITRKVAAKNKEACTPDKRLRRGNAACAEENEENNRVREEMAAL